MRAPISLLLAVAALTACSSATLPEEVKAPASPSFATVTAGGVRVTYPGTSFVVGGGAGATLTCNYTVTVLNSTGETLWGYATVTTPGVTGYNVSGVEMIPVSPSRTNLLVSVTGPSSGFTSILTFHWVGGTTGTVYGGPGGITGSTYCTYI
jgi:hypothetical protein